jgi:hypothetical protein
MCGLGCQGMETIRLPKLPFGKGGSQRGSHTRPLKAVQQMKEWAKAQTIMLYAVEHDEIWVHKGFNDVRPTTLALKQDHSN